MGPQPFERDRDISRYLDYRHGAKRNRLSRFLRFLTILFFGLIFILGALIFTGVVSLDEFYSYIPFVPHTLQSVELRVDDKMVVCSPSQSCEVRPSDSIGIVSVRSNAPFEWGISLISPVIDAEKLRKTSLSLQQMLPHYNFDDPQNIKISVMWLRWPIGSITITGRWTPMDWIVKAQKAEKADEKIWCLLKALEGEPEHVIARLHLADILFQEGDYKGALKHYEKLSKHGATRHILERIVDCNKKLGRPDDVVQAYTELFKTFPDTRYFKDFISYLRSYVSPTKAKLYAETASSYMPEPFLPSLWLFLADTCTKLKEWDCVTRYTEKVYKKTGTSDLTMLYNLGVAHWKNGEYRKAISYLETYLSRYPDDDKAVDILGECYEKVGDLKSAEALYRRIVQKKPTDAAISRWLETVERIGDQNSIMESYRFLTKAKPSDHVVWFNLGVLSYKNKKIKEAKEAFLKAHSLKSNDVPTLEYLQKIYHEQNDYENEKRTIEKLVSLKPKDLDLYGTYFELVRKHGKIDAKSEEVFRSCAVSNPKASKCYEMLLYVLLKNNKKKEAATILEELVKLEPKKPELLLQLAKLNYSLGLYKTTLANLKQYLDERPDDKEAKELYMQTRLKLLKASEH